MGLNPFCKKKMICSISNLKIKIQQIRLLFNNLQFLWQKYSIKKLRKMRNIYDVLFYKITLFNMLLREFQSSFRNYFLKESLNVFLLKNFKII